MEGEDGVTSHTQPPLAGIASAESCWFQGVGGGGISSHGQNVPICLQKTKISLYLIKSASVYIHVYTYSLVLWCSDWYIQWCSYLHSVPLLLSCCPSSIPHLDASFPCSSYRRGILIKHFKTSTLRVTASRGLQHTHYSAIGPDYRISFCTILSMKLKNKLHYAMLGMVSLCPRWRQCTKVLPRAILYCSIFIES